MSREEAIKHILKSMGKHDVTVSTTGFTSREVYEYRDENS